MSDPLAGLDDIPWRDLRHAYGAATDTPGLLRRVAKGSGDDDTWAAHFSSLAHQGTVYSASAVAAPFLIALTHSARGRDLQEVLALLEPIAVGGAGDGPRRRRAFEPRTRVSIATSNSLVMRMRTFALLLPKSSRAFRSALAVLERPSRPLSPPKRIPPRVSPSLRSTSGLPPTTIPTFESDSAHSWTTQTSQALPSLLSGWRRVGRRERGFAQVVRPTRPRAREPPGHPPRGGHDGDPTRPAPEPPRTVFRGTVVRSTQAENRAGAFDLGHSILWLAFHRRLGGPGRKPRPFVFVESTRFPMPCGTGGGHLMDLERIPRQVHWRDARDRPPGAEWTCLPYLETWDSHGLDTGASLPRASLEE